MAKNKEETTWKIHIMNTRVIENRIYSNVCSHLEYFSWRPFINIIGNWSPTPILISSAVEIIFVDVTWWSAVLQLPDPSDVIFNPPQPTMCNHIQYLQRTRPIHIEFIWDCSNWITLQTIWQKIQTVETWTWVILTDSYTFTESWSATLYSNWVIRKL